MRPSFKSLTGLLLVFQGVNFAAAVPAFGQDLSWSELPGLVDAAPRVLAENKGAQAEAGRAGYLSRSFQPKIGIGLSANGEAYTTQGQSSAPADQTMSWLQADGSFRENLWRGGQDLSLDRSISSSVRAAQWRAKIANAKLLYSARSAYLDAWLAQEQQEGLLAALSQTAEDRKRAERKAGAGLTTHTDVDEFDLRLLSLGQEMNFQKDSQEEAQDSLSGSLGSGNGEVSLGAPPEGWPSLPNETQGKGLDEMSIEAESQAAKFEADGLGTWPRPSLDFNAQGREGPDGFQFKSTQDYRAGLGLTFSLWDGSDSATQRSMLKIQVASLDSLGQALDSERRAALGLAAWRISTWSALTSDLDRRVKLAEEFRKKVSDEYQRGLRGSRELEDATDSVLQANQNLIQNKVRAWLAWAQWQAFNAVQVDSDFPSKKGQ